MEGEWYFYNWIHAGHEGAIFENFIASSLHRASFIWTELGYGSASLWYVRNFDGSEVDFLIVLDGKPALLVEAKLNETKISHALKSFGRKLGVPGIQVVRTPGIFKVVDDRTMLLSADRFLSVIP